MKRIIHLVRAVLVVPTLVLLLAPSSNSAISGSASIPTSRVTILLVAMAAKAVPADGSFRGHRPKQSLERAAHIKKGEQHHEQEPLLISDIFNDIATSSTSSVDNDGLLPGRVSEAPNLRKLKPKSKSAKKRASKKSGKKGKKKGSKGSLGNQAPQTNTSPINAGPIELPNPGGSPSPTDSNGLCQPDDQDCLLLFSEDYENPWHNLSDSTNMPVQLGAFDAGELCVKPEGELDALYYLTEPTARTMNLAYGRGNNLYNESYLYHPTAGVVASIVCLKTFKETKFGKSLSFSDDRGGKYAIALEGDLWDKRLRLQFDTQGRKFVAFSMDSSSFWDPCPKWQEPSQFPTAPTELLVSVMDQSSESTLDHVTAKGEPGQPDKFTIVWTRVCGALNVTQALDWKTFFDWNASTAQPALFDDLVVIASNDPNKRPPGC